MFVFVFMFAQVAYMPTRNISFSPGYTGFLQRLENVSGYGNVMEHDRLAKSHAIL